MPSFPLLKSRAGRAATLGVITSAAIAGGVSFATADSGDASTATPIKHLVVLYQENTSFDHYFGTYPNAKNLPGETPFTAAPGTPSIDGLTPALLTANPNAGNPVRLSKADVIPTIGCDNTHSYTPEQQAFDGGKMDKFVEHTTGGSPGPGNPCQGTEVMNYYDGNTVTGLWNYAQHFAMSDNSHGTGFGPSTIGALNLVSGNTGTVGTSDGSHTPVGNIGGAVDNHTAYSNLNPPAAYDKCSGGSTYALDADFGAGPSKNIGDLMNGKHVSWGWFQGGFTPTPGSSPISCGSSHVNVAGASQPDYDPHHNPFAYYQSTSNPNHTASNGHVGEPDDPANHQYDTTVFDDAVKAGTLPAVSFVKAAKYQDGHPGNSDPLDEQTFLVNTINEIEASPEWDSTAIIIAWDDSDGWYDHQAPTIVRSSSTNEDALTGPGQCGKLDPAISPGAPNPSRDTPDRCGVGPRLPLLVVSPYAKTNFVDHTLTDQTSILKFIETNWGIPVGSIAGSADVEAGSLSNMFDFTASARAPKLVLDPTSGVPVAPVPTPVPVPAATPVPPGVVPVVTPVPTPALVKGLGALTCKGKRTGSKKVVLTCKAKVSVKPSTNVRARLLLKKKLLGTASATVKKTTVTITIKTKTAIKKGKYTLTLSIATAGAAVTAQTGTLKL